MDHFIFCRGGGVGLDLVLVGYVVFVILTLSYSTLLLSPLRQPFL